MKIYTKTGDDGTTSLFGGKRVLKDNIRIEAYGTLDELNSWIGLLNCSFEDKNQNELLTKIQNNLFDIGSYLACDGDSPMIPCNISTGDIEILEQNIDLMEGSLSPLKNFILPGGSIAISYAHLCRTVSRRAERRVLSLNQAETVNNFVIQYLNRLSDYFFVLSRFIAHISDVSEIKWQPKK